MVGLDAAGKTTILYKLKLGEGKHGDCRFPHMYRFPLVAKSAMMNSHLSHNPSTTPKSDYF